MNMRLMEFNAKLSFAKKKAKLREFIQNFYSLNGQNRRYFLQKLSEVYRKHKITVLFELIDNSSLFFRFLVECID